MSIRKRALSDGSTVWDVDEYTGYTMDGRRDRRRVTCGTLREARRVQAAIVAERDALRNRSGRITLSAYVTGYYAPQMRRLAKSSRDTYERDLRLRILPALGRLDVRDISRPHIQRMLDGCPTRATARKALNTLRTVLNAARADSLIVTNPACWTGYVLPPEGHRRDNGLVLQTFSDMAPLLAALDADGDPTVTFLAVTGLLMGLRPEERYGLDWADFDWGWRTVSVRRAYTPVSAREGGNDLKGTKTALSTRTLPLPDAAAVRLRPLSRDGALLRTGACLTSADGSRLSPSTGRKRWARWLAKHPDLPPVTLENMRHSYATAYLAAGGSVETLSRLLGHSDINTTYSRYVRPSVQRMDSEVSDALRAVGR